MVYISFTVAKKERSVWKPDKKRTLSALRVNLIMHNLTILRGSAAGTQLQESCLCVFDSVWTDNISTGVAFIVTLRPQHHGPMLHFLYQCCRSLPASPQEPHRLRCRRCGTGGMSWTSRHWCNYGSPNLRSNKTGSAPQTFSFAFDIGVGWPGDSDSWGGSEHWGHLCCF